MKTTDKPYSNPRFLFSAAHYSEMPKPLSPEYCILGRSNVGKSSFINHVLEQRHLAHVSNTPGKTSCANFFRVNDTMIWVDLPGYGYAKTSRSEKERWSKLIREYCEKRENLRGVIWLIDIRHAGLETDTDAYAWITGLGLSAFPVITKSDKLTQSAASSNVRQIERFLNLGPRPVVYSIHKDISRVKFWDAFTTWSSGLSASRSA